MLRLEQRPEPSKAMSIASPLLALAITVVIGTILFVLLGKDPLRGLAVFFVEPVRSAYALSELAMKATPLLLIALGLAVCFRSNVWNIGAEGQFVVGAIAASGIAMLATKDTGNWFFLPVLVVSEELDELFEICDRLLVIAQGRVSPSLRTAEATIEQIGEWMSGLWRKGKSDAPA